MNLKFLAQRVRIYYDKKRFDEIDLKIKKAFLLKKTLKRLKKRQIKSCQN